MLSQYGEEIEDACIINHLEEICSPALHYVKSVIEIQYQVSQYIY